MTSKVEVCSVVHVMLEPRKIKPDWWKTEVNKLGDAVLHAPWARPELTRREVNFVFRFLHPAEGKRLLDSGCGFGRHSLLLSEAGISVVGIDVAHSLLRIGSRRAKARGLPVGFSRSDAANMPFMDESFDCVISMAEGGIGYQDDDPSNERILAEIARVLRPCGKFIIETINAGWAEKHCPRTKFQLDSSAAACYHFSYNRSISRLTTRVWSFLPRRLRFFRSAGSVRLYAIDEMTAILNRLGLDIWNSYGSTTEAEPFSSKSFRMVLLGAKRE
ncbi:class I SAM-dependent methyltransferase [bacterium]|nr:class I SAM-dependent methyltransferase [bacterium]